MCVLGFNYKSCVNKTSVIDGYLVRDISVLVAYMIMLEVRSAAMQWLCCKEM